MPIHQVAQSQVPNHKWERTTFSKKKITDEVANEVIEYYAMFKAYQEGEKKKIFDHTFKTAELIVDEFLHELKVSGVNVLDVYLRFNASTSMTVLILVPQDQFISDEFDAAYDIAEKYELKEKTDIFDLDFNYATKTENIVDEAIAGQGFFFKMTNDEHFK